MIHEFYNLPYKCLDDFVNEYDGRREKGDEFHIGLDFMYGGVEYRMCLEPHDRQFYVSTKNRPADDKIVKVWHSEPNPDFDWLDYRDVYILGIYPTMDALLEGTCIGGRPFRDVIMDDGTLMLGKD